MKNSLLDWFEKRRKSNILQMVQKQISKAIDTVLKLNNAVTLFSKGEKKEVEKSLERLFLKEVEIDDLRKKIFTELTKGGLPPKYREDLKGLVEHLGIMADHVKDSGRRLKILIDTEIPKEILDQCVKISKSLVDCAKILQDSINMFEDDALKSKELADKVNIVEDHVDEVYYKSIQLSHQYANEIDHATLITLRDFVEFMEQIADKCADTADYVRLLVVAEQRL